MNASEVSGIFAHARPTHGVVVVMIVVNGMEIRAELDVQQASVLGGLIAEAIKVLRPGAKVEPQ
jgi:hypothetical protein